MFRDFTPGALSLRLFLVLWLSCVFAFPCSLFSHSIERHLHLLEVRLKHLKEAAVVLDQNEDFVARLVQKEEFRSDLKSTIRWYRQLVVSYFRRGADEECPLSQSSRLKTLREELWHLAQDFIDQSSDNLEELAYDLPDPKDTPRFLKDPFRIHDFHRSSDLSNPQRQFLSRLIKVSPALLTLELNGMGKLSSVSLQARKESRVIQEWSAPGNEINFIAAREAEWTKPDLEAGQWISIPLLDRANEHYFFFFPRGSQWSGFQELSGKAIEVWRRIAAIPFHRSEIDFLVTMPESVRSENVYSLEDLRRLAIQSTASLKLMHSAPLNETLSSSKVLWIQEWHESESKTKFAVSVDLPLLLDDFYAIEVFREPAHITPLLRLDPGASRRLRQRFQAKELTLRSLLAFSKANFAQAVWSGVISSPKDCAEVLALIR
jgi:hypothetical protein